jgi:hypothetical protein
MGNLVGFENTNGIEKGDVFLIDSVGPRSGTDWSPAETKGPVLGAVGRPAGEQPLDKIT